MSFHPKMAYDASFHRSERELEEEGPPFVYTPENRARFDEIVKRYPAERRRSAVLPSLYLAQQRRPRAQAPIVLRELERSLELTSVAVGDFLETAPARAVGRNHRSREPVAVYVGVEIIAWRDAGVEIRDIQRRADFGCREGETNRHKKAFDARRRDVAQDIHACSRS